MRSVEPGIHNPRSWLWIPGLRQAAHPRCAIAHRGMTVVRIALPSPPPSLRAQRSNPSSLRTCHGLLRCARNDDNRAALFQHDPRRCVIAGAFFGSDLAIDARLGQARRECGAEEKVIEPEPGIARPAVSLVVPEREHRFFRMKRPECVNPALIDQRLERGAALRLYQRILVPRP